MIIELSKKEIFDEVEKRTSLEGSVLPERFEGIWSSESDGHFLDSYWKEGYAAIIQLLKKYIKNDTINYTLNEFDGDETISIKAEMPKRFSTLLEGSVVTDIKMLIACNIIHGWLAVKAPDLAAKYLDESKGYSEDLRVKLLWRGVPNGERALKETDMVSDYANIYPECEYLMEGKRDFIPMSQGWNEERVCKETTEDFRQIL